jgi:glycosyltransferase involved in cell wall biosynthesis
MADNLSKNKLKVCVLGSCNLQHFPIIYYGGIESCVEHLCTGLSTHFKEEIQFCVIVPKILEKRDITAQYNFNIIEANYVGCSYSNLHPINFALEAKRIIENAPVKPDVIWAQGDWSAKGLHELGIPIISTIHDSGPWVDGKYIFKENVYYRFVSKFLYDFVLKDAETNNEVKNVKTKSFWCHSGLDDYEYDFESNKEDYILWVAGLNWGLESKGLDTFIELARRLPTENFVAYGTGNDEIAEYLVNVSKELPNFNFKGKLNRDHTHREAFKKAKLFAMLSRIPEAFGRTGLEALSKGTPVIGSNYGSVPEQIGHPNIGFCSDNIDEIVDAIKNNKFDSEQCYKFTRENYHVKNEIRGMIEFTKSIL